MLVMPPNWRRIGIWFLAVVPGSIISVVSLGLFLLFLPLLPHRGDLGLWDARGLSSAEIAVMISGLTFLVSTIGTVSMIWLAWRNDKRQTRESLLKTEQL